MNKTKNVLSNGIGSSSANHNIITSNVIQNAQKYKIPPSLIFAVIKTESNFNPNSASEKGAKGLMQIMPETQRELGIINPYDPKENIEGGVAYLSALLTKYKNLHLALAAYNSGPGTVDRYKRIPPFHETRSYVNEVIKSYRMYNRTMKESNRDFPDLSNLLPPSSGQRSISSNGSFQVMLDQAAAYEKNGDTAKAITHYHRIIIRHPVHIAPYLKLSDIYQSQRNFLKAINILKIYLAKNKKSKRANEVKNKIVELTYAYRYPSTNPSGPRMTHK